MGRVNVYWNYKLGKALMKGYEESSIHNYSPDVQRLIHLLQVRRPLPIYYTLFRHPPLH